MQAQESKQDDLDTVITRILEIRRAHPALAWQQFYLLLCLPLGLWLFNAGALVITSGRGRRLYYYYTAYWRARRALRQAQEKQQVWLIYAIFVHYIGDRLELDQASTITYEYLCSYMHTQFTQEEYKQWCIFLQDSLYVSAYAPPDICNSKCNNKQIFLRAREWLVRLRARK